MIAGYELKEILISLQFEGESRSPFPVDAEVKGYFAIHRDWQGDSLTVTHVPTGLAVAKGLRKARARRLINELTKLDFDWSFTDPKTRNAEARAIIQRYRSGAAS